MLFKKKKEELRLSRFLFKYPLTPWSTIGVSQAELIFGRPLRSQSYYDLTFSLMRTIAKIDHDCQAKDQINIVYIFPRTTMDVGNKV